jgi:hypothetical protein
VKAQSRCFSVDGRFEMKNPFASLLSEMKWGALAFLKNGQILARRALNRGVIVVWGIFIYRPSTKGGEICRFRAIWGKSIEERRGSRAKKRGKLFV